jgi:riboflavin kinase/FMN adenylyltransferase
MFTFLLHPDNLFNDREFELIYTEEEKRVKLQQLGIDTMISYPFSQETRNMEPEDFIKHVINDKLGAKALIVGEDFCFGKNRRGDVAMLRQYEQEYGFTVIACEKKKWKNEIISSSAIRTMLKKGDIEAANRMLGQPFSIRGEVVHGRRLGRTIGIPTINLIPPDIKLLPPCGVYASRTLIGGIYHNGVTNIGYKPTVGGEEYIGIETNIFNMDKELYGEIIEVELISFIRPEIKFDTLEELTARMREDIIIAKSKLNTESTTI